MKPESLIKLLIHPVTVTTLVGVFVVLLIILAYLHDRPGFRRNFSREELTLIVREAVRAELEGKTK